MFRAALLSTLLVLGACGSGVAQTFDFGVEDAAMAPPWMQPDFARPDAATPSPLTMVTDLDQRAAAAGATTYVEFAGAVWFGATGPNGPELYKSDGTTAGTTIGLDLSTDLGAPNPIAAVGDKLLFLRSSAVYGAGLWATDGTLANSSQVFGSGASTSVGVMGGKAYFLATITGATRLCVTDGTVGGTSAVSTTLSVGRATILDSTIWLSATDGTTGFELWKSDGTTAGTVLVKDINPGATASNPAAFTSLGNGKVLFFANDGTDGVEPWITDGTAANTSLVLDINAGAGSGASVGSAAFPVAVNGVAYFSGNTTATGLELWRSDGTPGGTTLVKEIVAGTTGAGPLFFTVLGNKVLFIATTPASGRELWITDGTAGNTTQVLDINPGVADGLPTFGMVAIGSAIYFVADDGTHGRELWASDGTAANTVLVDDLFAGARGGLNNDRLTAQRGRLWFAADDATRDQAVYSSDGTASGTNALSIGGSNTTGSAPHDAVRFGDRLLFIANDGLTGAELYVTDGTAGGTMRLTDLNPGVPDGVLGAISVVGGVAYFRGRDPVHGLELWKSDGTAAGTVMVADVNPGTGDSLDQTDLPAVIPYGDKLVFRATNGTQGFEPWATMGTAATTAMLVDLDPGAGDGMDALTNARVIGGKLYFDGYDSPTSPQPPPNPPAPILDEGLFVYDGATFTRLTGDDTIGSNLSPIGNTVYYTQSSVFIGGAAVMAKTDGTTLGTSLIGGVGGNFMTAVGSSLAISTSGELFESDGTAAGTKLVSTDGPPGSFPVFGLGVSGASVYYLGGNGTDGRGLWSSDLTTSQLVAQLAFTDYPAQTPIVVGQQVYFTAGRQDVGIELFASDGTTAGTHVVADARPGPASSTPIILSAGDHDLYVSLDDGVHGLELWRLTY